MVRDRPNIGLIEGDSGGCLGIWTGQRERGMTEKELEALRRYLQANPPIRRVRPWGVECKFPWGIVVLPEGTLLEEFWTVPAELAPAETGAREGKRNASAGHSDHQQD